MAITIALAGNPNCGKTTLFNQLTGSNQYVGNWPGVTVEKKEGKLKGHKDVTVADLPGIYSLSPYTLEEVVARNYLIDNRPDVILNIVDGTNLERNLYLTTQLKELGIPVVLAVNMMDIVAKNGDEIRLDELSKAMGCQCVKISALKGDGVRDAAEAAIKAAEEQKDIVPVHSFSEDVQNAIERIEEMAGAYVPAGELRFFAVKLFERDDKIRSAMKGGGKDLDVESIIRDVEKKMDDDAESIITNERYLYIQKIIGSSYTKKNAGKMSLSDKIDTVVTNRWLALPIFALVMFIVYYFSIQTIGTMATDWVNDGVFGDGFYLFGNGREAFDEADGRFQRASAILEAGEAGESEVEFEDEESGEKEVVALNEESLSEAKAVVDEIGEEGPDPAKYGTWIPSIPAFLEGILDALGTGDVLKGLILDGIVAGVGAVLGFVPQMLVLFLFLAFLEGCGYMARIAFIMDRIFRKFGLSGKSFIPMLIGTGCGVPGVMASRTIENERDRRMTIMTTTFIPCGAKLPIIALLAGACFNNSAWVGWSAYFMGVAAIVFSGIVLKKTKMFAGEPAPFVMELPAYHMPRLIDVLKSVGERGSSFIRKAGTIILLSTILIWFTSYFGFTPDGFRMLEDEELGMSMLAAFGNSVAWIFRPLGWGDWKGAVAAVTGLVAKENVVATFGILFPQANGSIEVAEDGVEIWDQVKAYFGSGAAAYSFLAFNLLCAPCFAAIGAIRREMNNGKWTCFAIAWECGLAYCVSLAIYQFVGLATGVVSANTFTIVAAVIIALALWGLFRPYKESVSLDAGKELAVNKVAV